MYPAKMSTNSTITQLDGTNATVKQHDTDFEKRQLFWGLKKRDKLTLNYQLSVGHNYVAMRDFKHNNQKPEKRYILCDHGSV